MGRGLFGSTWVTVTVPSFWCASVTVRTSQSFAEILFAIFVMLARSHGRSLNALRYAGTSRLIEVAPRFPTRAMMVPDAPTAFRMELPLTLVLILLKKL